MVDSLENKDKNTVIIALKPGQLGNLLLLSANFIGNAGAYGYNVYNPTFYEYMDYFQYWEKTFVLSYPKRSSTIPLLRLVRKLIYLSTDLFVRIMLNKFKIKSGWGWQIIYLSWDENCNIDSSDFVKKIKQKRYSFVWGWGFRDDRNYISMSDEIRKFFSPKEDIRIRVDSFIKSIRKSEEDILIAIHIRHGDYKSFMQGRFFYTIEQYVDLMRKAEKTFAKKQVKFIVFSNAQQDLPKDAPQYSFGPGHFIEDLYAMAQCDYIIGPPSTFSRWASYFGKKPLYCVYNSSMEITSESFSDQEYTNLKSFELWPSLM